MEAISFILHFDEYLIRAIEYLGPATYALLFGIVFAETGLVVTPFLPGDSLLFAAGTLSGSGSLNLWAVIVTLLAAAVIGDSVNYWVGTRVGPKVFSRQNARIFKPEYLHKTHAYYQKHGGKTIIIARFVPIVRTFAPFVAGVGKMDYARFLHYNVLGAVVWVAGLTLLGYFFGNLPFIQHNFEYAILAIIALSILPGIIEFVRHRKSPGSTGKVSYEALQKSLKK